MRASGASDFSVEVIANKFSRRSAVRSSAWLDRWPVMCHHSFHRVSTHWTCVSPSCLRKKLHASEASSFRPRSVVPSPAIVMTAPYCGSTPDRTIDGPPNPNGGRCFAYSTIPAGQGVVGLTERPCRVATDSHAVRAAARSRSRVLDEPTRIFEIGVEHPKAKQPNAKTKKRSEVLTI
jgi:hypothetical protein